MKPVYYGWGIFIVRRHYVSAIMVAVANLTPAIYAEANDAFWRVATDRYARPVLRDRIDVPQGLDPYGYLAAQRGYDGWSTRSAGSVTVLFEQSTEGVVPILCLHKIGNKSQYELTPERFKSLLTYINTEGWYLIADYQYLNEDLSHVPTGFKPIVMGSDDASYGNLIYKTHGDELTGRVKRFFGKPLMKSDSMAAILRKHAKREGTRINFTFYISFDAIPFRQLDEYENPGFPYSGIPIVKEKFQYLNKYFLIGIHSLSHIYAHDMGPDAFAQDVSRAWDIIDEYLDGQAGAIQTIAFPYGIDPLTAQLHQAISSLTHHGRRLVGGFDFDNQFASAPGSMAEPFDVSRYNVDNENWDQLIAKLDGASAVVARRELIWETDTKRR
ncbi:MAG: hypothetical protein B6D68_00480 [spirochete symbiont of Stewartia floridana]|nr:MAG: hypothetical protein B6D68_00480 [spirochete symbiont of Stewartia floridana]